MLPPDLFFSQSSYLFYLILFWLSSGFLTPTQNSSFYTAFHTTFYAAFDLAFYSAFYAALVLGD